MILVRYQAMLLMLTVLICQSLAASPSSILSHPRQLQVRTDPRRAAIVISRTVTPSTEPPTTPATTPSTTTTTTEAASASNLTTTQSSTVATTPSTPPPSKTTGAIELRFAAIRELNATFAEIGGPSHSFSRFNDQNLGFLSMQSLMSVTSNQLPQSNSVRGVCMDSRATLNRAGGEAPNGTVVARMCAVESNGRVIRDGENMEVRVGQFQLSVEIVDWQWCGCGQQQGSYLDFELSTEVPSGYKISLSSDNNSSSSNMPVKISLGTNDSFVMVSSKYQAMAGSATNAAWKSMPVGYPLATLFDEATARRVNVIVRVPRQGSGDRITVMSLIVEPGYISSEHVNKPTSAAPPYVATPMIQLIATASFVVIAAIFSRH